MSRRELMGVLLIVALGTKPIRALADQANDDLVNFLVLQNKASVAKLEAYTCEIQSVAKAGGKTMKGSYRIERDGENARCEQTGDYNVKGQGLVHETHYLVRNGNYTAVWTGAQRLLVYEHRSTGELSPDERGETEGTLPGSKLQACSLWFPPLIQRGHDTEPPNAKWAAAEFTDGARKLYRLQRLDLAEEAAPSVAREYLLDPDCDFLVTEFRSFSHGKLIYETKADYSPGDQPGQFKPTALIEKIWRRLASDGAELATPSLLSTVTWSISNFRLERPPAARFDVRSLNFPEGWQIQTNRVDGTSTVGIYVDGKSVPWEVWDALRQRQQRMGESKQSQASILARHATELRDPPPSWPIRTIYVAATSCISVLGIVALWRLQVRGRSRPRS